MRSEYEYQEGLRLLRAGINSCEVGRRLGVPRGTIRDWRVGVASGSGGRTKFGPADVKPPAFDSSTDGWTGRPP
jgi:hypothetical protein